MKASYHLDKKHRPRHVFHPVGEHVFRFIKVSPDAIDRCQSVTPSPDGRGSLGVQKTETGGHIAVIVVDKRAVQVSSEHVWPTLTARWVNSKLVYIERSFNDHFGHVCLYDCHREQIVIEEFMTDGSKVQQTELASLKSRNSTQKKTSAPAGRFIADKTLVAR